MRIAMIGQKTNLLHVGGVETHVHHLSDELEQRGHEVVTYVRRRYGYEAAGRPEGRVISRPCIHTKHLEAITHSGLCALEASMRKVDVVHFHGVGPSLAIPLTHVRRHAAVCVTVHDQDYNKDKWSPVARRMLRMGERSAVRRADGLIVVARYLRNHLAEQYGREADYIPNGAESLTFRGPGATLEQFGLEPGRYVMFVGRLVPEKGCDRLIAAIRASSTPYTLAVIGGASHSDAYVDQLHQLAAGDPRITFLGRQYGDALAELRSNAAAYVMPSLQEGLPLTMLEALWCGLPVIATDIPAVHELDARTLADRVTLVPPDDVDALQAAVDALPFPAPQVNRPDSLVWPGWAEVAEQVEAVYERIAGGSAPQPVAQESSGGRAPAASDGRL
jgi:glycosyltransferase involved in cell wall biosynthesis